MLQLARSLSQGALPRVGGLCRLGSPGNFFPFSVFILVLFFKIRATSREEDAHERNDDLASELLKLLGGPGNIAGVENCMTRMRVSLVARAAGGAGGRQGRCGVVGVVGAAP
ncbi:PTS transporter subunit EIIB, partial [Pseudoclavibacter helvolus]|uniref:PTS transporter subunit EIIB n=1 Tax=Pseudoclavibacter helvolus TaxID=255205 RepID=UPI0024AD3FAA